MRKHESNNGCDAFYLLKWRAVHAFTYFHSYFNHETYTNFIRKRESTYTNVWPLLTTDHFHLPIEVRCGSYFVFAKSTPLRMLYIVIIQGDNTSFISNHKTFLYQ